MAKQLKLTHFIAKQQAAPKNAADENANGGVVNHMATVADPEASSDPTDADDESEDISQPSKPKKIKLKKTCVYQKKWETTYSWLTYDDEENVMRCTVCMKAGKTNTFTTGTNNFRVSTLTRHIGIRTVKDKSGESKKVELPCDHKEAVKENSMAKQFEDMRDRAVNDQEHAVIVAMKVVYWLAKESLPIHKYGSLLNLLKDLKVPFLEHLSARNATYSSDKAAGDMLESISSVIRKNTENQLQRSPFITILCDETTDVSVQKKLIMYTTSVDPDTLDVSTSYLTNVNVKDGKSESIYTEVKKCLSDNKIKMEKVMGLGTDSAPAMISDKKGLAGKMKEDNPMLVSSGCIAHKLALCTSQAANTVPYMKEYQEILTSLFYHFKKSAVRSQKLTAIQEILDEPKIKVKEVFEVRWLSFFNALEVVFKCLDSLLTYFTEDNSAKGSGIAKKIATEDFVKTTYVLMDIIPVVNKLCETFQKKNLDISYVPVAVQKCLLDLEKIKTSETDHELMLNEDVQTENGRLQFKEHTIAKTKRGSSVVKRDFISNLVSNINQRFPQDVSSLMTSFAILALRPIAQLDGIELDTWGTNELQVLLTHFGEEKERGNKSMLPIVDPKEAKDEWTMLKRLCKSQGYPRDSLAGIWKLINQYHREEFPNLIKLAQLALTSPIHTSDCERGFSVQNRIKSKLRCSLSGSKVDDLSLIEINGPALPDFDYNAALREWRDAKSRRIFTTGK